MNNKVQALDTFASGSLAAGWSAWPNLTLPEVLVGSPNVMQPTAPSAVEGVIWTGLTWGLDQMVEVIINNLASGGAAISLGVRIRSVSGSNEGYELVLNPSSTNQQASLFRLENGGATPLRQRQVTISAGDVWVFAAIGSVLFVYQNGMRIMYLGDATFFGDPAGTPGVFVEANSSAASSAQVSSIRLYTSQQQDGIWTKQGCTLVTSAAELSAPQFSGNAGLSVNFGPSQFLSVGRSVYRGYWVDGNPNLNYAESLDGINWTRYPNNPVNTGFGGGCVNWINGVAYSFGQSTPGVSANHFFTSTDGIHWTDNGVTTGLQVAGFSCYSICALTIIGGVFYGLFGGLTNANSSDAPVGFLATSTDGLHWTVQNGSAPVMNAFPGCNMFQIGNTYYMPATGNQPGQANPTAPEFDPVEGVLYQSTDLLHWTINSHIVHNALIADSLNNSEGGCAPLCMIDVNGTAYLYYQGSPGDSTPPQDYQCMLATAPAGLDLAALVGFDEEGRQELASDNFSSGPLSANWTTQGGAARPQVVAGPALQASALNQDNAAIYTGVSFSSSQYSEFVVKTLTGIGPGVQFIQPIVLGQVGSVSGYYIRMTTPTGQLSSGTNFQIIKKTAGNPTGISIGDTNNITLSVGDLIRFQAVINNDGTVLLTVFQNGFQVLFAQDFEATYTSGFPGIYFFAGSTLADAQISSWAGGNANVIPAFGSTVEVAHSGDVVISPPVKRTVSGKVEIVVAVGPVSLIA